MPALSKKDRRNKFICEDLLPQAEKHARNVLTFAEFREMPENMRSIVAKHLEIAYSYGASAALDAEDGKVRT